MAEAADSGNKNRTMGKNSNPAKARGIAKTPHFRAAVDTSADCSRDCGNDFGSYREASQGKFVSTISIEL